MNRIRKVEVFPSSCSKLCNYNFNIKQLQLFHGQAEVISITYTGGTKGYQDAINQARTIQGPSHCRKDSLWLSGFCPDKSSSSMFQHSSTEIFTTDLAQQVSGLGTQQMGWWMQNRWVDTLLHGWTPGPIRFQHTNVVGVNSAHMFSSCFWGFQCLICLILHAYIYTTCDLTRGTADLSWPEDVVKWTWPLTENAPIWRKGVFRSAMYTLAFCCGM